MATRDTSGIHLYLDDHSLKMVRVRSAAGRDLVTGLYYKSTAGLPVEALPQEVKNGMAALHASQKRITLVLPSQCVITKNVEVPSLDAEEIRNIVRLQAVRHTPYSRDEVIVDHVNLEVMLERYTKVLLVIVSNENVRKWTDMLEIAGYEIEAVHLAAESMARWVGRLMEGGPMSPPCGLFFLDFEATDFIVVHNHKPYFLRSIPIGARQIREEQQAAMVKLVDEFRKTLDAYHGEDQGPAVKRYLVAGAECHEREMLLKSVREELGLETNLISLKDRLPLGEEAEAVITQHQSVPFLDVLADGLVSRETTVDLLPDDMKVKRSYRSRGKEMFIAATYVMAIFILIVGLFLAKIYFRHQYLKDMSQNFEVKQKEADELVALSEEMRFVKLFRQKKGRALEALNDLQEVLPEEMYLSEITLTDDGKLVLRGTSELMSTVFGFVTDFEAHPRFRNVTSDYTKSRKENEKDVSDFGVSAILEGS